MTKVSYEAVIQGCRKYKQLYKFVTCRKDARITISTLQIEVLGSKGFRGPKPLVSEADWMPGTARAPVSLSYYNCED